MRPKTNDQDSEVEVPVELAHRAADGIGVLLLWDQGDGRLRVVIDDLPRDDGGRPGWLRRLARGRAPHRFDVGRGASHQNV